jgi:hypothetical protein
LLSLCRLTLFSPSPSPLLARNACRIESRIGTGRGEVVETYVYVCFHLKARCEKRCEIERTNEIRARLNVYIATQI